MKGIYNFFQLVGSMGYILVPMAIAATSALIYAVVLKFTGQEQQENGLLPLFFSFIREAGVFLGLMGTIISLAGTFDIGGATPEELRNRIFQLIGHGFWCTFVGIWIALHGLVGLAVTNRKL
jgi:hypothetical protein